MRSLTLMAGAAAALSLVALATSARADDVVSCRSYAAAAADDWAGGRITPAEDADKMQAGRVVVISYGRKYSVARHATNSRDLHVQPLGELTIQRNKVYQEELDRCLGRSTVKIVDEDGNTISRIITLRVR